MRREPTSPSSTALDDDGGPPQYEWLATLVFAIGAVLSTLQLVADGLQGGAALDASNRAEPMVVRGLCETSYVFYGVIGLIVAALMLASAGSAILATGALPRWTETTRPRRTCLRPPGPAIATHGMLELAIDPNRPTRPVASDRSGPPVAGRSSGRSLGEMERDRVQPPGASGPTVILRAQKRPAPSLTNAPGDVFQGVAMMLGDHPVFPILLSTDLEASRAFYRDTLGLEILREDEGDRIVFRCGGGTQLAVTLSTIGTSDTQTQMAWRVPDLKAAVADLRARGIRIEEYEAPDPVTADGIADMGHSWAAWFVDPSRNVLAVVQPKG